MKKLITTSLFFGLLLASINAHSQALRINGYAGELVFRDGHRIPVSGATMAECRQNYEDEKNDYDPDDDIGLYTGRDGNQPCVPLFVYRSPVAPSVDPIPGLVLWPEIPVPPVCLSCPWFDEPLIIEKLYSNHAELVHDYVKSFKIDQYNQALRDLQLQYQDQLTGFEQKMFALDQYLSKQDKP